MARDIVTARDAREIELRVGVVERVAWTVALGAGWAVVYFGIASGADPGRARDLMTTLDRRIPFVAASVWIYLAGIACPALPVFVVQARGLFRRTGLAYATVILASAVAFAAWPVSSSAVRADLASIPATDPLSAAALRALYALDPPVNLCPSLHVSLGTLAALAIATAAPRYRLAALAMVVMITASVCTVKQHFVLDVVGGLLLAGAAAPLILADAQARAAARMNPARSM